MVKITRKRDLHPGASEPRNDNGRISGAYIEASCDRVNTGVSITGDQKAIESRLSRRARMAIRSSKQTQSPSVANTQPMKKRGVGRPRIFSVPPPIASDSTNAHPPDTPYAVSSRIARQLRLSIRRQTKTARLAAHASTSASSSNSSRTRRTASTSDGPKTKRMLSKLWNRLIIWSQPVVIT
ncbi:unnamed protein product [Brassica rapa subsp. trilocularis]